MRIVVIDNDMNFTNSLSQRWKSVGVFCQVFQQPGAAFAEIKKDPDSVDIVLIAKEQGGGQDGLAVAQMLRKDPKTADVPYILMSSTWGKAEFAKHQKSEFGANAYFSKKGSVVELDATIEAVTGFKFGATATKAASSSSGNTLINVQLQAASEVVNIAEDVPNDISMEAPINLFPDGEPPIAPEAPKAAAPKLAPVAAAPAPAAAPTPASSGGTISEIALTMPTITTAQSADVPMVMIQSAASAGPTDDAASAVSAPAAASASAVISAAETPSGGIEIAIGGDLQIETSGGNKAAPPPVPVVTTPEPVVASVAPPSFDISAPEPAVEAALAAPSVELPAVSVAAPVSEEEAAKDLPYLFAGPSAALAAHGVQASGTKSVAMPAMLAPPHIDTGGPLSNDVETLKKYLTMREQDVSVLTAQLTYAKEEIAKSEDSIKRLTLENEDLFIQVNDLKKRVDAQDQELQHAGKSLEGEVEQLRLEVKAKIDRIKFLEDRLNDSAQQYEKLKERVRLDIRKIRVREKELESKLEILKKDSETLIGARENKILELKRKIDLLEFNYDTLQDRNDMEKQNVVKSQEKIDRVLKVIKLAMGIIEAEGDAAHQKNEKTDPGIKVA